MDYRQAFSTSAIGMSFERARVDVSALNLANANTALAIDGSGYRPMRVVAKNLLAVNSFSELIGDGHGSADKLAPNFTLEPLNVSPRQLYEPGHPLANARGFVSYPGVDTATETVTMMSAMRAYEANVAAMNTSKNMALKALEIGGAG